MLSARGGCGAESRTAPGREVAGVAWMGVVAAAWPACKAGSGGATPCPVPAWGLGIWVRTCVATGRCNRVLCAPDGTLAASSGCSFGGTCPSRIGLGREALGELGCGASASLGQGSRNGTLLGWLAEVACADSERARAGVPQVREPGCSADVSER